MSDIIYGQLPTIINKKSINIPTFREFINNNNITYICLSNTLRHFDRIYYLYNLCYHEHNNCAHTNNTIYFGMYTANDYDNFNACKCNRYIMPGGSDITPIFTKFIKDNRNIICISNDIFKRVHIGTVINFDLIDHIIFKPIYLKAHSNTIYIYDGNIKSPNRNKIYNKSLIDRIINSEKQYNYILSSVLNVPYSEMPNIYNKCFICIRLTAHDGNANTAQECALLNIPIIHNQSTYGLKWKNLDDIIKHINNVYTTQKC
jgi:hypothetical protein